MSLLFLDTFDFWGHEIYDWEEKTGDGWWLRDDRK